jgi:hypothetical protein
LNWRLVAAGVVMLFGATLHGIVGDDVLRKIGRLQLPANPFGSPADTKVAVRITWHFGTVAFAFLGAWLVATGLRPRAAFAVGVTYLSGTLLSFLALAALGVRFYRHGLAGLFKNPGPLLLCVAAILVWWGATSLRPTAAPTDMETGNVGAPPGRLSGGGEGS